MPSRKSGTQTVGIAAARAADRDFFLAVRNEPTVRRASFRTSKIDLKTHDLWYRRMLRDPGARAFKILAGTRAAGTLRVTLNGAAEAEVHVSLLPEWRGRGVASGAVRHLLQRLEGGEFGWKPRRILARVKPANRASLELFESHGFVPKSRTRREVRLIRDSGRPRPVTLVVDGGPDVGMGHITRASALARELEGFETAFYCRQGAGTIRGMRRFLPPRSRIAGESDLRTSRAVVVDTLTLPEEGWVRRAVPSRTPVLLVGNYLEVPAWARLCVNPYTRPNHCAAGSHWVGDPAYTVLAPEFAAARRSTRSQRRTRTRAGRILVFAGGGNTGGMVFKVLAALKPLSQGRAVTVVAGGYFTGMKRLLALQKGFERLTVRSGLSPAAMSKLMLASDAAILSYGRSCDEARAVGLPAFVLSSNDLNRIGGRKMEKDGGIVYGGDIRDLDTTALERKLRKFLDDSRGLARLGRAGRRTIDGKGGQRIARLIARYAEGKA